MAAEQLYGNDKRKFTKIMQAKNGRYAVFARNTENDKWVQVESVLGMCMVTDLADELETHASVRASFIVGNADDTLDERGCWEGDDAPEEAP